VRLERAGSFNVLVNTIVGFTGPEYLYDGRQAWGPARTAVTISHWEANMRALFAFLALLGVAGIALGVLTIVRGMSGAAGHPFSFENYGGPGPIIAGLIVLAASLYLRSFWKSRD
jgi:hypothetical protein